MVSALLPTSDAMLQKIVQETAKNPPLQKVSHHILNCWPKGVCPGFYPVRGDLCMSDGLLLRQNRIVIPHSMRQDMLQRIHEGHLGVEKCKRRARQAIYWPGINGEIETMVQNCETCLKYRYKQTNELMLIADLPTAHGKKLALIYSIYMAKTIFW